MEGVVIGIVVIGVILVVMTMTGAFDIESRRTIRPSPPPRPLPTVKKTRSIPPPRRRRHDGGFYPIGYAGTYRDDEHMVDGFTVLATIAVWDIATREQYNEVDYMNEWQDVDYSSAQPYDDSYEYTEPEVEAITGEVPEEPVQAEATEFEDLSSDSGWDSGDSDFGGGDDW